MIRARVVAPEACASPQRFVSVCPVFYNFLATQPLNSRTDKLSGLEDATGGIQSNGTCWTRRGHMSRRWRDLIPLSDDGVGMDRLEMIP
jgi:hypothetical protein